MEKSLISFVPSIKVWWLCVAENGFPLKGIIYTGKVDNTRDINQGERICNEMQLLSTMHDDANVADTAHQKPEMILFYKKTKAGVDRMEQMYSRYTTQRQKFTWPLAFFFNILDVAALAAYIVYYENNQMTPRKTNQRKIFLGQLAAELAMPMIEDRDSNQQIMRNRATKQAIESYIHQPSIAVEVAADNHPRDSTGRKVLVGSCHICNKQPIRKRRMTRKCCVSYEKTVCDEHTAKITKCLECMQYISSSEEEKNN